MSRYEILRWYVAVAAAVVVTAAGSYVFVHFVDLDAGQNQAIAAWVQAIGSICAIAAGFAAVRYQLRANEVLSAQSEAHSFRGRFTQILLLAHEASEAVDDLKSMLSPLAFQEYLDDVPKEQDRQVAKLRQIVRRVEGIGDSVSDLIRSTDIDLEHVNLLLKLQGNLQNIGQSLVGVDNPFIDLHPSDIDYDEVAADIQIIRFTAGLMSNDHEGTE